MICMRQVRELGGRIQIFDRKNYVSGVIAVENALGIIFGLMLNANTAET